MEISSENDFIKFNFKKPILYVVAKDKYPDDDEFEFAKNTLIQFFKCAEIKKYRFCIIFDTKLLHFLSAQYYKEMSDTFINHKSYIERFLHKSSIITDRLLMKGALNLFFTIYTTIRPLEFSNNYEDSVKFVLEEYK